MADRAMPDPDARPLVLSASRWRNLGLAALCAACAVAGILMIRDGLPSGWFVAGVFAVGGLAEMLVLSPWGPRLRADRSGLTLASLWRREHLDWVDIEGFGVYGRGHGGRVVVALTPERFGRLTAKLLVKGASGSIAMLPDAFGRRCEALAQELEAWRQHALARAADSG
jgi:hypothetical protein